MYIMILTKRITNLDRLTETVPKPTGALLNFGLPKWKMMPLEHKIPMIPGPKDAYNLTRCKVGRKLWRADGPKMDFDLTDPYYHETRFPYEALHDQHLLEFFSKPINLKCLLKANLITRNMDAKCSLREYNAYRKYLGKIHATRIKKEIERRDCLSVERKALRHAEEQTRKELNRLKKREKLADIKQRIAQQRLLTELKILKQKEKMYKVACRFELFKLIKQEKQRLLNIKRKERTEWIRQKCHAATEIARRKVIDIHVNWKKKDKARRKAKEKRLANIARRKQNLIEERWRRKLHVQQKDMTLQRTLLQRIHRNRQKFINDYKDKINKETAKMQKLFDNAKLLTTCYVKRQLPHGRTRICCKHYGYDTRRCIATTRYDNERKKHVDMDQPRQQRGSLSRKQVPNIHENRDRENKLKASAGSFDKRGKRGKRGKRFRTCSL